MEFFLSFLLCLCLFLSLSTFILVFLRTSPRKLHLPPGNLGLPFIGETLQLISAYKTDNPEPFIDRRVARFGTLFTTHVFGEPTVFSADPETNRFILKNEGKLFECSYPKSISNLFGKHSLLLMKGSLHKKMHSLTINFGSSSMIRDHLLGDIDRLIRLNLKSWSDRVFLMDEAKKITFELAVKQLMSIDPCEWTENLRKEYVVLIEGFFTVPLAVLSPTYRRAIQARRKVAKQLSKVVEQRRKKREGEKDMLEALLRAEEGSLGDEEIVDFMVALLVAGYDTVSTTITLAVKFLTETPLALAQLKEEHDEIRAKKSEDEPLEWADYKSMEFTQFVVKETLRFANIISGVFRRATTDIEIKGYTIPKGWKVFTSFRAVHLNHDYFKDARSFNPWRWQESGRTSLADVYSPFGGGQRLCPGYEIAKVELSVFLHHLVTTLSWDPAEVDRLVFFPTTRTLKRYPINVKHRTM